jgi:cell division protein FtsW (lipid II flippase)
LQPTRALDAKSLDTATSAKQTNSELALTLKVLGWGLLGAFAVVAILVFDGQTSDSMFWYWVMGVLVVVAVPLLLAGYRADRSSEANQ